MKKYKLFVANTTKQHHKFMVQVQGMTGASFVDVPAGQQVMIGEFDGAMDSDGKTIASGPLRQILNHAEFYGALPAKDLYRLKKFTGICYSIGEEVKTDQLLETFEANETITEQQQQERREDTAAAISQNIAERLRRSLAERGLAGKDREDLRPKRVVVEITEDDTAGKKPEVAVGVEVLARGEQPRHEGKEVRRNAAN